MNEQTQSKNYKDALSGALQEITVLKRQLEASQGKGKWVGVRNTLEGLCWVPVLGGKADGSENIKIPGKEARPIPGLTWEWLLNAKNPSVSSGHLVRDDSILGIFGMTDACEDFNEKRYPNAVLDADIEGWFSLSLAKFETRIGLITNISVVNRIIELGNSREKKPFKHLEAVKKLYMELANPLPPHFDEIDDYDDVIAIGNMLNVAWGPKLKTLRGDVAAAKRIVKAEMDARRAEISQGFDSGD